MKKKFLISAVAASVALSAMGALVACGDDEAAQNAELAQKAIATVRTVYADKAQETPIDYEVMGQTKVDNNVYPITWSVTSSVENFGNYVVVGDMDATTTMVTIHITQTDVAVEYKLIASVTVGESTETAEFSRKIPAAARNHAGTAEDPYEAANVKEIGAALASGKYYEVDGEAQLVYVKGYVVDPGTVNAASGRVNYVYIVDEYDANKNSSSADAVLVYSISYKSDSALTGQYPLNHGDEIVVVGYIQNYSNKIEVTYKGSVSVYCTALTPAADTRSAQDKADAAKDAVALATTRYTVTGDVTLPVSSVRGVTLSWAVKEANDYATITNNVLTIASLPSAETDVVLTVTATVDGTETAASKDVTVKLAPGVDLGLEHAGTAADPYTLSDVNKLFATLSDGDYYTVNGAAKEVYITGWVTDGGTVGTSRLDNVYIADDAAAAKADSVMIYYLNWDAEKLPEGTTLTVGDKLVVKGYLQKYKPTNGNSINEITYNNSRYVEIVSLTEAADDRTPAEKVAAVKTALTLENSYNAAGDVALPKTSVRGVTLTWTSDNALITIAADNGKMTIGEIPEGSTTVTVTATITCGEGEAAVTETKPFTVTLSKEIVLEGEGTLDNPYTVADVKKILNTLDRGESYLDEDGTTVKQVFFRGFVTVAGTAGSYGYNNVYVGATATTSQNDSVLIYSVNWSDVLTSGSKLRVGDEVVVRGYLKDYNGKKEVADNGATPKDYPVFMSRTEVVRTDAEKLTEALGDVPAALANIEAVGNVTLPLSTDTAVTFAWTVKNANGVNATIVEADGVKKLHIGTLPDAEATVTLTVTAHCGDEEDREKEVTVLVKAGVEIPEGAVTASYTIQNKHTEVADEDGEDKWANGKKHLSLAVDDTITVTVTPGDGDNNSGNYYKSGYEWRMYQNSASAENPNKAPTITVTAATGYKIFAVKITYNTKNGGVFVLKNDTAPVYNSGELLLVDAASIQFTVRNTGSATNGQANITKVEVIYVVDTEAPANNVASTASLNAPEAIIDEN